MIQVYLIQLWDWEAQTIGKKTRLRWLKDLACGTRQGRSKRILLKAVQVILIELGMFFTQKKRQSPILIINYRRGKKHLIQNCLTVEY